LDKNKVLEFAIKMGVPKENIDNIKKQISEDLSREDIEIAVKAEFAPKIAALKPDLFKEVVAGTSMIDIATGKIFVNAYNAAKKIPKNQKEILEIEQKINDEIAKRIQDQKDDVIIKEGQLALSQELGEEDEERLQIERQLSNLSILESDNTEKRVQKEIELIRNSKFMLDDKAKLLKLEELNNKLVETRLQKRKQEMDEIKNLLFQFEKADVLERARIERLIELQAMPEKELISTIDYDKGAFNLVLENIGSFSQTIQAEVAKMIASLRGIDQYQPVRTTYQEGTFRPTATLPNTNQPTTYTPVQIGAMPITVDVNILLSKLSPDATAEDISEAVKAALLGDERFLSALRIKI
jgi:hypothetical protein